jgi:uncharacterized protein
MSDIIKECGTTTETLRRLLAGVGNPFAIGDRVGIKIHWGERGNHGFLHPRYTREIVRWLLESGVRHMQLSTL